MGSFNVACSVSGISINYGDPVVYFPLMPGWETQHQRGETWKRSYLIYGTDLLVPYCLPLHGTYGDYGLIENVERNENVELLEKYFHAPIEDVVQLMRCNRRVSYYGSEACRVYGRDKVNNREDRITSSEWMLKFGFEQVGDNEFSFPGKKFKVFSLLFPKDPANYTVRLEEKDKDGYIYTIHDKNGKKIGGNWSSWHAATELQDEFENLTDYALNVKDEYQVAHYYMRRMSGMFVHGDIYKHMVEWKDEDSCGALRRRSKETTLEDQFDELHQQLAEFDARMEEWSALSETDRKAKMTELDAADIHTRVGYFKDPAFEDDFRSFLGYFHKWNSFKDSMRPLFAKGALKKEFCDLVRFDTALCCCNKFYFPACNGEQHGNDEASTALTKKTLEVLETRKHRREEDW